MHGSSPHTWGTLHAGVRQVRMSRFIPTHVGNTNKLSTGANRRTVHPHTRGEHALDHASEEVHAGSSPHTWGTPYNPRAVGPFVRFIPTHVGNTSTRTRCAHRTSVHPHTRGEHDTSLDVTIMQVGSSPHTWGTHGDIGLDDLPGRFIPTHVGNTNTFTLTQSTNTVHPHTRGEHIVTKRQAAAVYGSSPHTWGTPGGQGHRVPRLRFIPTHVGNTRGDCGQGQGRPVHPHTRGEHSTVLKRLFASYGSSPHTWGTHEVGLVQDDRCRFIPTHVGNTSPGDRGPAGAAVHPHTRGEHDCRESHYSSCCGSSPHTWGTPDQCWHRPLRHRFIPTHVGNTNTFYNASAPGTVHPHTRGEHSINFPCTSTGNGSSPHTWGTPLQVLSDSEVRRFIPTHVGNTFLRRA